MAIYKGTTPTYIFTLPDDIDLSTADSVYVTFSKKNYETILTKEDNELEIQANTVSVFLDQEDTLSFPRGDILVQINWLYEDGSTTKRACSEIITIPAKRNLIDEVI